MKWNISIFIIFVAVGATLSPVNASEGVLKIDQDTDSQNIIVNDVLEDTSLGETYVILITTSSNSTGNLIVSYEDFGDSSYLTFDEDTGQNVEIKNETMIIGPNGYGQVAVAFLCSYNDVIYGDDTIYFEGEAIAGQNNSYNIYMSYSSSFLTEVSTTCPVPLTVLPIIAGISFLWLIYSKRSNYKTS